MKGQSTGRLPASKAQTPECAHSTRTPYPLLEPSWMPASQRRIPPSIYHAGNTGKEFKTRVLDRQSSEQRRSSAEAWPLLTDRGGSGGRPPSPLRRGSRERGGAISVPEAPAHNRSHWSLQRRSPWRHYLIDSRLTRPAGRAAPSMGGLRSSSSELGYLSSVNYSESFCTQAQAARSASYLHTYSANRPSIYSRGNGGSSWLPRTLG